MRTNATSMRSGVALVLLALLVSACGSSSKTSDGVASTTTASTSSSSKAATTTTDPAADLAAAKALVLVAGDLPPGWTATPHTKDPADVAAGKQLAVCLGTRDPSTDAAQFDGPDFDRGDAQITSSASIAPTRAAFEQDLAALRSPKLSSCFESIFRTIVQDQIAKDSPGATIGKIGFAKLPMATVGEATEAFRVTIDITVQGQTTTVFDDSVQFGKGRSEVTIDFTNPGAPFDAGLESTLVVKAAAKLGAAR